MTGGPAHRGDAAPGDEASRGGGSTVLVVPCFNEVDRLEPRRFLEALEEQPSLRYLFVDDGSVDRTRAVLEEMRSAASGRVQVLRLPRNVGKGEAVRAGVGQALTTRPGLVGYWDADLSTPLSEVGELAEVLRRNPAAVAVFGSRVRLLGRPIHRRPARHYKGRVFATAVSLALDLPIYDSQCGAKLFRPGAVVDGVFERPFAARWIFDVEIVARIAEAARAEGREAEGMIIEHPLSSWTEVDGSRLRLRDYWVALYDLYTIASTYRLR